MTDAIQKSASTPVSAKHPAVIWMAAGLLAAALIMALFGERIAPLDPSEQELGSRLLPPGSEGLTGSHLFGTDALGRDIFSLILVGAAPALLLSTLAVGIAAFVGTSIGMFAGYRGGRAASALIYVTNIQLAFPFLLLAITVVGILRPSVPLVVAIIALGVWVPFARVAYTDTTQIRDLDYIEAVKVMRGSDARIIFRHILPNVAPNILVLATFALGHAIVMESGLSFVGLGVPTEAPTWGRMLSEGRDYMQSAWWLTVFPGLAIFLLVLAINLLGEHLRDSADPKMRGR